MSTSPMKLVTDLCNSLLDADMVKTCAYLSEDVVYHNMPWAPVVGHAEVRKVLDPLVHGPNCALRRMEISHTVGNGDIVMNARLETWERRGIRVELPVAGLFEVRDGRITRWCDYWDLATIQPLLKTLSD
ncbi:MAG: limonene-1,2-epoxide hydrolase family protein [Gammaproteobacteria bacterium]